MRGTLLVAVLVTVVACDRTGESSGTGGGAGTGGAQGTGGTGGSDGAFPTFTRTTLSGAYLGDVKAIGDVNNDGALDLVIGGSWDSQPLVWWKATDGPMNTWPVYTVESTSWSQFTNYGQVADLDGDGDNDIVVPDTSSPGAQDFQPGYMYWWENPCDPLSQGGPCSGGNPEVEAQWSRRYIGGVAMGTRHLKDVFVSDYDGDGKLDVAARVENAEAVIWFQDSIDSDDWTGPIQITDIARGGQEGLWSYDLDGDGDEELIGRGSIAINPGTSASRTNANWIKHHVEPDPDGWPGIGGGFKGSAGDLDGDGRVDLVWSDSEGGYHVLWYKQPAGGLTGTWTRTQLEQAPKSTAAHSLWVDDYDDDGDNDVMFATIGSVGTRGDGAIHIYENTDGRMLAWTEHTIDAPTEETHNIQVADIDNDGDPDLFGAGYAESDALTATVWVNELY